ncbi:MAG: phenylalanine--tRNA ligase subunit alpha [Alphaproteobacteria bacterium]|nr:phenylalanine--tRNA ligase subunit alpha [Alphaproteobacteria bacterium]
MSRPDVDALLAAFRAELAAATTPEAVDEVRRLHAGKKSPLKEALRALRDVPEAERPSVAAAVNAAQQTVEAELDAARARLDAEVLAARLDAEWVDLSLPGVATPRGARHPVTRTERVCMDVMRQLGFELVDGPEVEDAFHNFDALNIPEHHPARDMQDTFWVDGGLLLRSHTTTVQARVLEARPPLPIKVVSMGRVYRNEAVDATHLAMFHQFEGIWVDRGLTFSHLKGTLAFVARALFGQDRKVRFKPKFYPYTEPSVGVDVSCGVCGGSGCEACHGAGWVTILGAGMIHPKVFAQFGYDPDEVSGIAFGLGTTRMMAQSTGVTRIRSLYEPDLRTLQRLDRGA